MPNYVKAVRVNRIKYYYVFETLLCSGMRIGELTSINFSQLPAHRVITSEISGEKLAEIIINTEKTCKKREIYIPIDAYNFFSRQERLKGNLIKDNFISFRR
ncbi:MAG: hypothetical protein MJ200_05005 [Mycoplasmoidaceae bacterium]|nr:hypothetical protein [Mycoplasmoidaceae bacterium]